MSNTPMLVVVFLSTTVLINYILRCKAITCHIRFFYRRPDLIKYCYCLLTFIQGCPEQLLLFRFVNTGASENVHLTEKVARAASL